MTARAAKTSAKRPWKSDAVQKYTVFISHSSLDIWIAERIAEKIEETGAGSWLDVRNLEGGGNIREEINKGVRECQEVIVLFSPNSVGSHWISFEVGAASMKRRHLTPIMNNVKHTEVPLIQGMKAINLNEFSHYLADLKKRIKRWTDRKK